MRFLGRSLLGLFLLAVTAGLLLFAVMTVSSAMKTRAERDGARPSARERVMSANVQTITPATVTPTLSVHGEVSARRSLDLRTLAGGTIVEMADNFETGGKVIKGQTLLRIDPTDFQRALELAKTDLTQAEAELRDARAALELAGDDLSNARRQAELREAAVDRQRGLIERGVGTEAALETASLSAASAQQAVLSKRQAVISAEARVSTAEATLTRTGVGLDEAQMRLDETEIRAEISGTLEDVTVLRGGIISSNEKIARIVDATALEVSFRVSTAQYARLLGQDGAMTNAPVTVRLDATGVDLATTGSIARESAAVGEGQTGRQIFATLDAAPGFRPGDFVTVQIKEPELRGAVVLPSSALSSTDKVLLLGEENRLEEVQAELLRRQGDDVIVRLRGFGGREAVRERNPTLGAGIRVKPIRQGTDGPVAEAPKEVDLTDEQKTELLAFVEGNQRMPQDRKDALIKQINAGKIPLEQLERLQGRMRR